MSQLVLFRSPLMALNDLLNGFKTYLLMFFHEALSLWFIVVLEWAGRLAEFALRLRMGYLTNVLGLKTTHAAAILNGCFGAETIMPVGMAFLADAFVGNYRILFFSSVAYSLGMGFLTILTLSVLSKYAGILSCEDSPNCSAKTANSQRVLFYISIPFIIIGISGHMVSVPSFIDDQQEQRETKNDQDDVEGKKPGKFRRFFRKFALFWAVILLNLAFALISWPVQFGVPTIGMIVATLLFMSRSSSYKYVKPQGSPLTTISRVFVAAASKRHCLLPQDADKLHENPSTSDPLPHTQGLRCLDKAAIVAPTETSEQNRKLCSVTEVEETKIFVRMIPLWMTFVTCGVLLSVGDTFFLYQAYNLDVRHFILLLIFQKIVEKMLSTITKKFTKKGSSKYAAPIGMIIAMLFSMACLMIAAKVEKMGLHSEKTLEMFWLLLPQFILLGAFEGISYSISGDMSTACFFNDKEVSNSIIRCLDIFSDCAFGIGILGGTAPVDIVKKYRSRNLQDTPNDIRLDYYYWTLAVVSSINLVFSILVTIWYYYQYSAIEDNRTPETDQLPTVDNAVVAVA